MVDSSYIYFKINNQNYGIPIMNVRSVEKYENISPVLGAPAFISGVMNLRSELIPVYSIRNKFNLAEKPVDDDTKLIVVNVDGLSVGIVVDSVSGIINVPEKNLSDRPRILEAANTGFVGKVAEIEGMIILLLNLKQLMTKEECNEMQAMIKADEE